MTDSDTPMTPDELAEVSFWDGVRKTSEQDPLLALALSFEHFSNAVSEALAEMAPKINECVAALEAAGVFTSKRLDNRPPFSMDVDYGADTGPETGVSDDQEGHS